MRRGAGTSRDVHAADVARAAVPAEFAQALRELGLAGRRAARPAARSTGGVSSDIWRIDTAHGPGLRQARAGQAARRGRLARADRAQPLRGALDAGGQRGACRAARRACSASIARLGVLVMSYLPPSDHTLWKQALRDGARRSGDGARGRRAAGAHPRLFGARARSSPRSSTPTRSSSTSASSPTCSRRRGAIPTSRRRSSSWSRRRSDARVALVHGDVSPKNILIGPQRAGVPRRRMRLVGRPGVRPRVLPQPPAAQVPVDAAGAGRLPRPLRCAGRRLPASASTGSRATALERRAAALLPGLLLARVDGKSPVEYITDEAAARARCGASAGALLRHPVERLQPGRRRLARGAGPMNARDDPIDPRRAASGTAAAGRRSRPR